MAGPWASWSLLVAGPALMLAGLAFPFLPNTSRAFLIEDAFEDPGLLLAALGALAGRQRLWPLGLVGSLLILAVDLAWRFGAQGPAWIVAWTVGAGSAAAWACWPMGGAGRALAVAQVVLAVVALAWLVHGTFLALGPVLPATPFAIVAVLVALGLAIALRGWALHHAPIRS